MREWLKDPAEAEKWYGHISEWDAGDGHVGAILDCGLFNKNLRRTFEGAKFFTSDRGKWQITIVQNMEEMFRCASCVTSDLSMWLAR